MFVRLSVAGIDLSYKNRRPVLQVVQRHIAISVGALAVSSVTGRAALRDASCHTT